MLILPTARAQNNASIHTSWLWHLHQPIYWPEKRAGSEHYENAWDTIQAQDAGRSHPVEQVRGQVFDIDDRRAAYQYRPYDALASTYRDDHWRRINNKATRELATDRQTKMPETWERPEMGENQETRKKKKEAQSAPPPRTNSRNATKQTTPQREKSHFQPPTSH